MSVRKVEKLARLSMDNAMGDDFRAIGKRQNDRVTVARRSYLRPGFLASRQIFCPANITVSRSMADSSS